MTTSRLRTTHIVLLLTILAGASSLLIASSGQSNSASASSATTAALNVSSDLKVGPQAVTRVPMIYDTDSNGLGGPADMVGPEIGGVSYRQGSDGRLSVVLHTDFAQPNTTYQVFLVCGPSHALACGFTTIGTLMTDGLGKATKGIVVPLATLQAPPFGCGYRTDHIDLIGGALGSSLTAGAINYFVPCAPGTSQTAPTGHGDPIER